MITTILNPGVRPIWTGVELLGLAQLRAFQASVVATTFVRLRVSAAFWSELRWHVLAEASPNVMSFESGHGHAPDRYAHNARSFARVKRESNFCLSLYPFQGGSDETVEVTSPDAPVESNMPRAMKFRTPLPTLAFFTSHDGSNLQAIIDACTEGRLRALPSLVVSNNSGSKALARARAAGIPGLHLSSTTHPDPAALDSAILDALQSREAELVVLGGYMKKLGPKTLAAFEGRILNSHPALLPSFGGRGMFGRAVHEAVLAAGVTETGITIHLVDEEYDHGTVVAQCRVPVLRGDDVEALATRSLVREHAFWVETLNRVLAGAIG